MNKPASCNAFSGRPCSRGRLPPRSIRHATQTDSRATSASVGVQLPWREDVRGVAGLPTGARQRAWAELWPSQDRSREGRRRRGVDPARSRRRLARVALSEDIQEALWNPGLCNRSPTWAAASAPRWTCGWRVHESVGGVRTVDRVGDPRRRLSLDRRFLTGAEVSLLKYLALGLLGVEPYVMMDPFQQNLLALNEATAGEWKRDMTGLYKYSASGGTVALAGPGSQAARGRYNVRVTTGATGNIGFALADYSSAATRIVDRHPGRPDADVHVQRETAAQLRHRRRDVAGRYGMARPDRDGGQRGRRHPVRAHRQVTRPAPSPRPRRPPLPMSCPASTSPPHTPPYTRSTSTTSSHPRDLDDVGPGRGRPESRIRGRPRPVLPDHPGPLRPRPATRRGGVMIDRP